MYRYVCAYNGTYVYIYLYVWHPFVANVPTVDVGVSHDSGTLDQFYHTFKVGTNYIWLSTNLDNKDVLINTKPPVVSGHSAVALICQQDTSVPLDGAELVLALDKETIGINGIIKRSSICEVCCLESKF